MLFYIPPISRKMVLVSVAVCGLFGYSPYLDDFPGVVYAKIRVRYLKG